MEQSEVILTTIREGNATITQSMREGNAVIVQSMKDLAAAGEKSIDRLAKAIEHIPAIEGRIPKTNGSQSWPALVLMVAVLAAVMSPVLVMVSAQQANITEIKHHQSIDNDQERLDATELGRIREKFAEVEAQFAGLEKATILQTTRNDARFTKLEEWQRWWYRSIPHRDATQDADIGALEGSLDSQTNDRFFGREGTALERRISELEDKVHGLAVLEGGK